MTSANPERVNTPQLPPETPALLHLDARICVVNKPAGVAVHRGWAVADHYLLDLVRDTIGVYLYPVHRLDQPTSGVVVFALDRDAARHLSDQFAAHAVFKRYLAVVRGRAPETLDLVNHALTDPSDPPGSQAKAARTWLRGLGPVLSRYSLVEAVPLSGRTHQIRRHLKHRSLHIIGDVKYGKGDHNRFFRNEYGLNRLALHALDLGFLHPDNDAPIVFRAPLTDDLASPLTLAGCDFDDAIQRLEPAAVVAARPA